MWKNEFYDDRQTIQQDWYFNPEKNELWGSDWMIFIIIFLNFKNKNCYVVRNAGTFKKHLKIISHFLLMNQSTI